MPKKTPQELDCFWGVCFYKRVFYYLKYNTKKKRLHLECKRFSILNKP